MDDKPHPQPTKLRAAPEGKDDRKMIVDSDRRKPFNRELRRRDWHDEASQDQLDAAQDAGLCLKMMRAAAAMEIEVLADRLGMRVDDLRKAERGQLVEQSFDGRLIDFPAALLVRVARLTHQRSIPLP